MNLYLISQNVNHKDNVYVSAVVVAGDDHGAARIYPTGTYVWLDDFGAWSHDGKLPVEHEVAWVPVKDVNVKYIGVAAPDLQEGDIVSSTFFLV